MASTKEDCAYGDVIEGIRRSNDLFHREIFGNGGSGMKDDIRALRTQIKINNWLICGVLGTVATAIIAPVLKSLF